MAGGSLKYRWRERASIMRLWLIAVIRFLIPALPGNPAEFTDHRALWITARSDGRTDSGNRSHSLRPYFMNFMSALLQRRERFWRRSTGSITWLTLASHISS